MRVDESRGEERRAEQRRGERNEGCCIPVDEKEAVIPRRFAARLSREVTSGGLAVCYRLAP